MYYRGGPISDEVPEIDEDKEALNDMRLQVRLLAEDEQLMDQLILNKQQELKNMLESSETNKYPFEPICNDLDLTLNAALVLLN